MLLRCCHWGLMVMLVVLHSPGQCVKYGWRHSVLLSMNDVGSSAQRCLFEMSLHLIVMMVMPRRETKTSSLVSPFILLFFYEFNNDGLLQIFVFNLFAALVHLEVTSRLAGTHLLSSYESSCLESLSTQRKKYL